MALTFPQGFRIANSTPVDNRTVFATLSEAKSGLNTARRYRGLRFFVTEEKKEYWFRDGIANSDIIEYRPGAMLYSVTSVGERNSIPLSLRSIGMEVNLLLGGNIIKYILVGGLTNDCWQVQSDSDGTPLNWEVVGE